MHHCESWPLHIGTALISTKQVIKTEEGWTLLLWGARRPTAWDTAEAHSPRCLSQPPLLSVQLLNKPFTSPALCFSTHHSFQFQSVILQSQDPAFCYPQRAQKAVPLPIYNQTTTLQDRGLSVVWRLFQPESTPPQTAQAQNMSVAHPG